MRHISGMTRDELAAADNFDLPHDLDRLLRWFAVPPLERTVGHVRRRPNPRAGRWMRDQGLIYNGELTALGRAVLAARAAKDTGVLPLRSPA